MTNQSYSVTQQAMLDNPNRVFVYQVFGPNNGSTERVTVQFACHKPKNNVADKLTRRSMGIKNDLRIVTALRTFDRATLQEDMARCGFQISDEEMNDCGKGDYLFRHMDHDIAISADELYEMELGDLAIEEVESPTANPLASDHRPVSNPRTNANRIIYDENGEVLFDAIYQHTELVPAENENSQYIEDYVRLGDLAREFTTNLAQNIAKRNAERVLHEAGERTAEV